MSVKVMSAVWERKDLDASERLLMLALADHADDEGYCYPSIRRLCERTSLSERTVQGAIKKLVARGFLVVRYGAGHHGTNAFIVNGTPAESAPPQHLHPANSAPRKFCATPPQILRLPPAATAPKPSRTIIEPSDSNASIAAREVAEAVAAYNDAAARAGWPEIQKLTDQRRRSLRARLGECGGLEGWGCALGKAEASDFLCGRTSKPWGGFGFDWLTKAANFTKLMEGNYDNRASSKGIPAPSDDPRLRAIFAAAGSFEA